MNVPNMSIGSQHFTLNPNSGNSKLLIVFSQTQVLPIGSGAALVAAAQVLQGCAPGDVWLSVMKMNAQTKCRFPSRR
jgi:hypothetical protein